MKRVELGKTGIMVSRLGIGTGTGLPSGHCVQALMDKDELARLLLYALDRGINFGILHFSTILILTSKRH